MGLFKFIGSQFAKPQGIAGRVSTMFMNLLNKQQYKSVVTIFNKIKPKTVLDIGFGNGYLLNILAKNSNSKFYGIEISKDMLAQACKRNKLFINNGKMKLSIADVCKTGLDTSSIDFAYTVNTVYFWDNLEEGYSEVKRILKNGGVFVNVFYTEQWLNKGGRYTKDYFKKYSADEMVKRVKNMNFARVELKEISKEKAYSLIVYK